MPFPGAMRELRFHDGPWVLNGPHVTRAAIQAEFPDAPIGSTYTSVVATGSTGRKYLKVTEAGAATDWQKFSTTAAD